MKKIFLIFIVTGVVFQSCEESKLDDLKPSEETSSWLQLDSLPSGDQDGGFNAEGFAFSIGNKGYLSGGGYENRFFKEYNTETKEFISKRGIGDLRSDFAAFSIGSMGYAGSGTALVGGGDIYGLKDFEQYNPQSDTWSRRADLPETLSGAVGFSMNELGYIGIGKTDTVRLNENNEYETWYYPSRSFYEYSPTSDCWIKKADFPGAPRTDAVAFSIGDKAYVGTGLTFDGSGTLRDFWEYDPGTNKWTKKGDFPGVSRYHAVGFSIQGKGYIGAGFSQDTGESPRDFWEYDPSSDSWKRIEDFPGVKRQLVYFSTGTKGYVAGSGGLLSDFWEFDPSK